ncbi:uncharacterized protein EI90DRAFT_841866 [Cantharellus anzutake]|uniref:uncharacterized protein n=1 Tax=Cantharellus anzutake TaxID=1750568 RepID=UPI0019080EE2|nr:uncharacterized protein EI90DRAFT_841866 [Cantharellus anzutake]KAF8332271.1 hypothetical protein EI90DRAFT_841866 [Cantharellus anzutake]
MLYIDPTISGTPLPPGARPGIWCDMCYSSLGTTKRYKCTSCSNFDLCDKCDTKASTTIRIVIYVPKASLGSVTDVKSATLRSTWCVVQHVSRFCLTTSFPSVAFVLSITGPRTTLSMTSEPMPEKRILPRQRAHLPDRTHPLIQTRTR